MAGQLCRASWSPVPRPVSPRTLGRGIRLDIFCCTLQCPGHCPCLLGRWKVKGIKADLSSSWMMMRLRMPSDGPLFPTLPQADREVQGPGKTTGAEPCGLRQGCPQRSQDALPSPKSTPVFCALTKATLLVSGLRRIKPHSLCRGLRVSGWKELNLCRRRRREKHGGCQGHNSGAP